MKNFKIFQDGPAIEKPVFFRHPELMGGSLVEITTQGL